MWIKLTSGEDPKGWNYFVNKLTNGPVVVPVLQRFYKTWKDLDLYLTALIEKVPTDVRGARNQVMTAFWTTHIKFPPRPGCTSPLLSFSSHLQPKK